ncbi:hypothetical protein IPC98_33890 [Pseudomonas aeruginosa]|nr:hypothetical protein IPC98_33890 [Pseudomonas aeruginosa]
MSWRSESPFTVGFRAYVGFWFHCSPNPGFVGHHHEGRTDHERERETDEESCGWLLEMGQSQCQRHVTGEQCRITDGHRYAVHLGRNETYAQEGQHDDHGVTDEPKATRGQGFFHLPKGHQRLAQARDLNQIS